MHVFWLLAIGAAAVALAVGQKQGTFQLKRGRTYDVSGKFSRKLTPLEQQGITQSLQLTGLKRINVKPESFSYRQTAFTDAALMLGRPTGCLGDICMVFTNVREVT